MTQKILSDCLLSYIDNRGVTPKKLKGDFAKRKTEYMVLSANHVKSTGLVKLSEVRYVEKELYAKWMDDDIQKADILVTSEAPAGEVLYWDSDEKVVVGQRLYALRINPLIANPLYMSYYLKSPKGQMEINKNLTGSTVFGISQKTFDNIVVDLPNQATQIRIGQILKAIDDKISNNTAINAELEAMAKTIYDYWFLQFEFPDENGKPYKSSGGKMVWNEELKREIPAKWTLIHCKDILDVVTGKEDANFATENGKYPFFTCSSAISQCDEWKFEGKMLLIAGNGDFNVKYYDGKCNAYQRTYVLIPRNERYIGVLYQNAIDQLDAFKKGSNGSIVKFITKGDVENIPLLIPNNEQLLIPLNEILDQIECRKRENQELASLRDFLLPLLMNGQVGFID